MSSIIGVFPGFQEITLTPGETYEGSFTLVNPNNDIEKSIEYTLLAAPYSVSDKTYSIDFATESSRTKISEWVSFPEKEGTISGNTTKEIKYRIDVPLDAPVGGQYGAILVRPTLHGLELSEGLRVNAIQQVANVIYATVEGEYTYTGEIIKNKVRTFSFDSPVTATSVVRNNGNVHSEATYYMRVYHLFSDDEIYSSEDFPKKNIIIPGTSLEVADSWDGSPKLGLFRVTETVSFLDDISTSTSLVFVCPTWFVVLWAIFLCCCAGWIASRKLARLRARSNAVSYISGRPSR